MENSKKDEFTPILSDIIRMMVMTRLGLAKEENRPILAMNILTKNKGISTEDRLSLLIAMPVILDKINRTLSDESIQDLKDAIEESGESAKDFINEMMVEEIDGKEFVEAALAHKNQKKIRGFKRSSCRSSKKQVGDQVTICHKLLTNMLVTLMEFKCLVKAVT
jgi:phage I-like protein